MRYFRLRIASACGTSFLALVMLILTLIVRGSYDWIVFSIWVGVALLQSLTLIVTHLELRDARERNLERRGNKKIEEVL